VTQIKAPSSSEQDQVPTVSRVAQMGHPVARLGFGELGAVALTAFGEPFRIMVVSGAQCRRGGNAFAPLVEVGICLGQPARPEPVDQHPIAVAPGSRFINSIDIDFVLCWHGRNLLRLIVHNPARSGFSSVGGVKIYCKASTATTLLAICDYDATTLFGRVVL
jgi:hypothetical protein